MRKIENEMNRHIAIARKNPHHWQSGNTSVSSCVVDGKVEEVKVYLWGNLIARVGQYSIGLTLAGWPTVTTRSRLNAIVNAFSNGYFYGFFQKNREQYIHFNGKPRKITNNEFVVMPIYYL